MSSAVAFVFSRWQFVVPLRRRHGSHTSSSAKEKTKCLVEEMPVKDKCLQMCNGWDPSLACCNNQWMLKWSNEEGKCVRDDSIKGYEKCCQGPSGGSGTSSVGYNSNFCAICETNDQCHAGGGMELKCITAKGATVGRCRRPDYDMIHSVDCCDPTH